MLRLTNKADTSDLVRKNSERSALIGRAISGRQIDAVLVQKMKSKGYLEASLCFKKADECAFAYARLSKQQRDQCESAKDELCKPVFACEDQEDKEEERRQLDDYYSRER